MTKPALFNFTFDVGRPGPQCVTSSFSLQLNSWLNLKPGWSTYATVKGNLEMAPGGSSQGTLWTLLASWFRDHHKGGPRLKTSEELKEREFWIYCFDVRLDWGGRSWEKIPRKGQGLFTPYSDATGGEDTKQLVIRIHSTHLNFNNQRAGAPNQWITSFLSLCQIYAFWVPISAVEGPLFPRWSPFLGLFCDILAVIF